MRIRTLFNISINSGHPRDFARLRRTPRCRACILQRSLKSRTTSKNSASIVFSFISRKILRIASSKFSKCTRASLRRLDFLIKCCNAPRSSLLGPIDARKTRSPNLYLSFGTRFRIVLQSSTLSRAHWSDFPQMIGVNAE